MLVPGERNNQREQSKYTQLTVNPPEAILQKLPVTGLTLRSDRLNRTNEQNIISKRISRF